MTASIRGKCGVRRNLVVALNIQRTKFTATSEFQTMTTEDGFSRDPERLELDGTMAIFFSLPPPPYGHSYLVFLQLWVLVLNMD